MAKGIRSIWIDSDTPESLGNKVIKDDVEIATVPNGVQEYKDPDVIVNREYKYVIQSYTATGQSTDEVLGVNLNYYTIVEATGLTPIMTNFRILEANPDRVYFDTPLGPVTGIDLTGFVISGNNINAVNTTENYFTVDSVFTFWSNNTIRLGETTDTSDHQTVLHNFTMRDIDNQMDEPDALADRFVSANGTGDGLTEGNAASISTAFSTAQQGQTWWVKAGTYPRTGALEVNNSGEEDSPIKFIGYKTDWTNGGDINGMYWNEGDPIDPTEMPYITGSGSDYAVITVSTKSNIIFRSIQAGFDGYGTSVKISGSTNIEIENFISYKSGKYGMLTWYANSNTVTSERIRYKNCKAHSGEFVLWMAGDHCKIMNTESWTGATSQYLLNSEGNNNIFKGVKLLRKDNVTISHTGHGINFNIINGSGTTYGLAVDCEVMNSDKSVEFRKGGTHDCVARNITVYHNGGVNSEDVAGPSFRDGAKNCVFENGSVDVGLNTSRPAIWLSDSDEGGTTLDNNIVRNTLFKNCYSVILYDNKESTSSLLNNFRFLNNTVYNCTNLLWETVNSFIQSNCEFKNNIVNNVTNLTAGGATFNGWTVDSNNWSNNGFSPEGTNQNTDDPNFANLEDFVPQEDSLIMGPVQFGVELDVNDNVRADLTTLGFVKNPNE